MNRVAREATRESMSYPEIWKMGASTCRPFSHAAMVMQVTQGRTPSAGLEALKARRCQRGALLCYHAWQIASDLNAAPFAPQHALHEFRPPVDLRHQ